jgi:hypothetical protein
MFKALVLFRFFAGNLFTFILLNKKLLQKMLR